MACDQMAYNTPSGLIYTKGFSSPPLWFRFWFKQSSNDSAGSRDATFGSRDGALA